MIPTWATIVIALGSTLITTINQDIRDHISNGTKKVILAPAKVTKKVVKLLK